MPEDPENELTAETSIQCPQGHVIGVDEVIIRNNTRVCPVCEASRPWEQPPPPWSRQALQLPLFLLAVAFGIGMVASGLLLGYYLSFSEAPGGGWQVAAGVVSMFYLALVAVAVAWIAILVRRP